MNSSRGFTLIELMIVIVICGVVLSIIVGYIGGGGVYGYMFSDTFSGRLESVESAVPESGIVSPEGGTMVFSVGVSMKTNDGEYITFSSEDRQWAAFRGEKAEGKCATVRLYPYAPWNISKSGTYHNGRLLKIKDC